MIVILILIGESGSGKSTIEKHLVKVHNMKKIISYTTRPIRQGEEDGVDYHFVTQERFDELDSQGFFAEKIYYEGSSCYYSIAKGDCTDDSIVVVAPDGLRQLLNIEGLNVTSFYIKTTDLIRFARMYDRGDELPSIYNRLKKDKIVFGGIENMVTHVIEDTNELPLDYLVIEILEKYYNIQYPDIQENKSVKIKKGRSCLCQCKRNKK